MKISAKGLYGLHVMLELALRHGAGPVVVATLAKRQGLPPKYLPILMGRLRGAGLVTAQRGPSGGFILARSPGAISALEIVEALEGPLAPPSSRDMRSSGDAAGTRAIGNLLSGADEIYRQALAKQSLADLAATTRSLAHAGEGYSI